MDNDLFARTLLSVWLGWMLLTPLLGILSLLINYWNRWETKLMLARKWQAFKWRWFEDDRGYPVTWFGVYGLFEGVGGLAVGLALIYLNQNGHLSEAIIGLCVILLVVFLPRIIIDVCKGLKWNHKDGKLEEIEQLKHRLNKLEEKS